MRLIDQWAAQREDENGLKGTAIILDYRDLNIAPQEVREVKATDECWVIEFADEGVRISSDYGYYDRRNEAVTESKHMHTGLIRIENTTSVTQNITFVLGIAQ